MDDFERGLGRAQDSIGRTEPRIRGMLQRLDLDTSRLGALREAQGWIQSTRPDLGRRSDTIRAEHGEWAASAALPAGLAAFDEKLYGEAGRDPDVYAAVGKLTEAAGNRKVDAKTVAALEKRTGDPAFALALTTTLGATRLRDLLVKSVEHTDDATMQRLQKALGKTLGTASPRLGPAYRDELTGTLDKAIVDWRPAYALALALKHGTFASAFLVAVARQIDKHAAAMSGEPAIRKTLMEALARDPVAAQDFFLGDPKALERYLRWPYMPDDGAALGQALEAATLTFRDHDGSTEHPSRGYLSALLASQFVHLEAERVSKGLPPAVPPATTARILGDYILDVNRVAFDTSDRQVPGVADTDDPSIPQPVPWGLRVKKGELHAVMVEALADPHAFSTIMTAQTAFAKKLLDHGAAIMAHSRRDETLSTQIQWIGSGFGLITDTAGLAKIAQGKGLDEAQEKNMKILTALANTGLAIPQAGVWSIVAGIAGAWTGRIEDSAKGDFEDRAFTEANYTVETTRDLLRDLTVQAMLKHELFGPADPPGPNHPWSSLKNLKSGDDPSDNPNNFLKDGRTLMTRDEMVDKTAGGAIVDEHRLDAYRRWLRDKNLIGSRWSEFLDSLDSSYSQAFSEYKK
ncbi:hypothetical protein OG320_30785 [Microbispora sp. NBC_01189]|uniref:hypothetical protein n=1 Tax=Microbispora sp. NBC_01189 TaxID=2903583 RepID=UPI002E151BDB|nr:hypothetical protein OG320_30785 [Microbispora sp. NBC_01189]